MANQQTMENTNCFGLSSVSPNYKKFYSELGAGNSCSIFGVQNSMRPALVSGIQGKVLYIVADGVTSRNYKEQFELMGKRVLLFPSTQDSFIYKHAQSNENELKRTETLFKILQCDYDIVVAEIQSLASFLPSISDFENHILKLSKGQKVDIFKIEELLVQAGYKKEALISENGQFSRRGEILDIFPIGEKYPYRIDFFDTEIETIKIFDIQTQKGTKEVKKISVCPYSDLFLTDEEIEMLKGKMLQQKNATISDADSSTLRNATIDEILTRLETKDRSYSLDFLAPYLDDFRSNIFDYLDESKEKYYVAFDESKQIFDSLSVFEKETNERIKELILSGSLFTGKLPCYFSSKQIISMFENKTCLAFLKITNANKFFETKAVFDFKTLPAGRYAHSLVEFCNDVRDFKTRKYKIFIFAGSSDQASSINKVLKSHDIDIEISKDINLSHESAIFEQGYANGFILPEEKIAVFGTYDIFPKKRSESKLKIGRQNTFSVPKVGDYVVHHIHGIGICEGVTQLSGTLGTKDYVVIKYRDGDTLYVPTTQMDMLDRFSGAEAPKKLSKIGGQDFSAVKNKVRESVKKLAFNLIELYAIREKIQGFAFSEDTDLQREFENSFPYTETEDQLTSVAEIKKDMESPKVMDRLVCGDVGFGKTEVALRAIFKAINDGKQVAFIAPTTILSEQHYNTARARMYDFGIDIEVLNRFKSKAQTEKILADTASGKVDLLCGTHRILSDDVVFKNLGLIVLDEEQKFGVEHKEKLKNKYNNVDSLTLSATPIPRTLSMSLSGIRDISIISTPPSERLPIQTYVTEYSEPLVRDAINRELSRDGQVFILFNSVEKIYTFAEKIRRLVPEAKILVAHGQMGAKEMEQVIYDFYHKKGDILICTTIIENGIDIENANTLIVYDADKLGLSQLYQIRGRVGRGSRMAYAYFTYEQNKILTPEAFKRLDAMSEFCEFGSGFKLAMRDLEIRGGGNILGAEQSGHLQKVGYDMYAKLLSDAVKELRGEKIEEIKDVLVKVAVDAYVPDTYIATSEDRMVVYKRISEIDSTEALEKLKLELRDTYGTIPAPVSSLMEVALVRQLAKKIGASEILSFGGEVDLIFDEKEKITESNILGEAIYKFRMQCSLDLSGKPTIRFKNEKLCRENFEELKKFLLTVNKIMQNQCKN